MLYYHIVLHYKESTEKNKGKDPKEADRSASGGRRTGRISSSAWRQSEVRGSYTAGLRNIGA